MTAAGPNQAMQRTLRARHEFCLRSPRAVPYASLILFSLDGELVSREAWLVGVFGHSGFLVELFV